MIGLFFICPNLPRKEKERNGTGKGNEDGNYIQAEQTTKRRRMNYENDQAE